MLLGDFVGNDVTLHSLKAYLSVTKAKDAPVRPLLFAGPSGSGKTSLAEAVAEEIGAPLLAVSATRMDWAEVSSFVLMHKRPVVLMESVDLLTRTDAEDFLVRSSRLDNPNTQWVFTTRTETAVPVALVARSLTFRMLPLPVDVLTTYVADKGLLSPEEAPLAIRMSGGFIGPLERHAEAIKGGYDTETEALKTSLRVLVSVVRGDRAGATSGVDEFLSTCGSAETFLVRLEDSLSEILAVQTGAPAAMPALGKLASMVPEGRVIALLKSVWQMQDRVSRSDQRSVAVALKAGVVLLTSQFAPAGEPSPVMEDEVVEKDSGADVVSIHEMRTALLQKGSA